MGPCIVNIFQYISNKMQLYTVYLYLETAVYFSGGTTTHHQERIQLYLQHLVFVTPLLLPAVIISSLIPAILTAASRIFDMYMSCDCGSTGENVTSERYTTWRQICPKTRRQSVTRRDVRYVPRKTRFRYMAPSRECASCLAHIPIRELASGSMLLDTSRVPQYRCARPVTCHSRYDN